MKLLRLLSFCALLLSLGMLTACRDTTDTPDVPEREIDPQAGTSTDGRRSSTAPAPDLPPPGDPFADSATSMADAFRALQEQRQDVELTAEQLQQLRRLKDEMGSGLPSADKLALLEEAGTIYSAEMLDVITRALDDADPQVRIAAMGLIGNTADANILPLVEKALNDPNEDVRQLAMSSLVLVEDAEVTPLLKKGLQDDAMYVRKAALEIASQQPDDVKYPVYEEAILNPHRDVQFESITYLQQDSTHTSMDVLIKGLKHDNQEHREDVRGAIEFLVQQRFESFEEARDWWAANKQEYNSQLFPKSLGLNNEDLQ